MRIVRGARIAGTLTLGAALVLGGCGYKDEPVPPYTVVPKPIEDLRYTFEDETVRMTWTFPKENIQGEDVRDISSFDLFVAEIPVADYCPTCPVPFNEPIEVDGGLTIVEGKRRVASYDYGMLRNAHKYFFKVTSRTDWLAASDDSNIITFVWHLPPAAPTGLTVSADDSRVDLSWESVTTMKDGSPVTADIRYQVLRSTGDDRLVKIGSPVTGTSYSDSKVKNGSTYQYKVQSLLAVGEDLVPGMVSDAVTATPVDTTPPSVPTQVLAIQVGSGIRIIWDSPLDEDIAGFRVYRRTKGESSYRLLGDVDYPSTTYVDSTAVEGVRYYYSVTAVDGSSPPNESKKSEEATLRH